MEFVATKRSKSRKRKRYLRKRRRERMKIEVISAKRRKVISERGNVFVARDKLIGSTMQADAFWKNYMAAQEWQKRHNVTWWRSRCLALEYENEVLKNKIRSLTQERHCGGSSVTHEEEYEEHADEENDTNAEDDTSVEDNEENETCSNEESFEFQVNEDMLSFLEQSIRHKMELKQKKHESELAAATEEQQGLIEGGAAWVQARNTGAKLLYGNASPRILAMETALQATVDRHKDKARPQYWPNIPLRP